MKEFDYLKYIKERKLFKEDMDDWGDEKDDYGRSEKDYKRKPSLADFDYDEEEYKAYMEKNFPGEPLNLGEAPNPPAEDSVNYQDRIDDMDELVGPQITEIVTILHDEGYNVNEVTKFFEYIAKETKNFYEFHFDETDNVDMSAGRGEMDAPTSI